MFAERQQQCSARVETAAAAAVAVRPVVPRTDDTALLRRQAAHKEERESAAARPTAQAARDACGEEVARRTASFLLFLEIMYSRETEKSRDRYTPLSASCPFASFICIRPCHDYTVGPYSLSIRFSWVAAADGAEEGCIA